VVVAPIGFVSDHMEVIYDLDVEARKVAEEIGLNMVRAATAGTRPAFVRMIRELILERMENREARSLGPLGATVNNCPPDCCLVIREVTEATS
jgi:ferrochelatase